MDGEPDGGIKQRVREQFAGSGDAYVRSVGHRSGKDLPRLVALATSRRHRRALDLATGGGHTAAALAPFVELIVPLDLTPHMLRQTRGRFAEEGLAPPPLVAGDAEDLPFIGGAFDLVTCRIAPHHFPDVRAAVGEIARVLRPGGRFILVDSVVPDEPALDAFINELERRRDPSHARSYTHREWVELLTGAGLAIEHAEVIEKRHEFADWTARSRMSEPDRRRLEAWVLHADPACKTYFRVEERDGRVVSFLDEKLLVAARRPA